MQWVRAVHAPAYLASKGARLGAFSIVATAITAAFVACTWVWDYAIDPVGMREALWLRGTEAAAVLLLAAVMRANPLGRSARIGLFLVPAFVQVSFIEVLDRLDGGGSYGMGGFLYFFIFVPFMAQAQSLRFNAILLGFLALLPNILVRIGVGTHLDLTVYNAYVWMVYGPVVLILALVEHMNHEVHTQHGRLKVHADTDALTGIPNRRHLLERGDQMIADSFASSRPVSLLLLDIDHFKDINDRYGHGCGDEILKEVAEQLQHISRDTDLVARLGGEEFVVVLWGTDAEGARTIAERIRRIVAESSFTGGASGMQPVDMTISAGIASAVPGADHRHVGDLIEEADAGLYLAKHRGRNRVEAADHVAMTRNGAQAATAPQDV